MAILPDSAWLLAYNRQLVMEHTDFHFRLATGTTGKS